MIVCFADDLTGSGDVGMQFRGAGLSTTLFVAQASASSVASDAAEAIVIDTDSRNVAASAAAERQLNAVAALSTPIGGDAVVYKKVDSTIRGNVGAEIAALMRALEMRCCLFAPAFPSSTTPRTTVGGFQLVGVAAFAALLGVVATPCRGELGAEARRDGGVGVRRRPLASMLQRAARPRGPRHGSAGAVQRARPRP